MLNKPISSPVLSETRSKMIALVADKIRNSDEATSELFLDDVTSSQFSNPWPANRMRSEMMTPDYDYEDTEQREDLTHDEFYEPQTEFYEIEENVKQTRSGRISKTNHLDSNFVYRKVEKRVKVIAKKPKAKKKKVKKETHFSDDDIHESVAIATRSGRRYKRRYSYPVDAISAGGIEYQRDSGEAEEEETQEKEEEPDVNMFSPSHVYYEQDIEYSSVDYDDPSIDISFQQEDQMNETIEIPPTEEEEFLQIKQVEQHEMSPEYPETITEIPKAASPIFAVPRVPRRLTFRSKSTNSHPIQTPNGIQSTSETSEINLGILKQPARPNENLPRLAHKSLLTSLRTMMISLDVPIPISIEKQFERNLARLSGFEMLDLNEIVSFAELQVSINSCFLILGKCSVLSSEERSISLRDFTLLFRNMLISLQLPFLNDFENTLKTMFGWFSTTDKKVSVEKLQMALNTIIAMVAP
uniref:NR LBD domain-containing protein n=1 Tax=Caenorhabditis tropicalis TaxID=1561998 RepID=A0A1I7SZA2_9PELO